MSITIRQLRQFAAIAEAGSFRAAAEQLFTAQPALSVSIQRLESVIGVQLLNREPRGVSLTPAGEVYLENIRSALYKIEQAQQAARMVALGEQGSLVLGFVGSATYRVLPMSMPHFNKRHPDIQVQLRENTTSGILDLIKMHEIDVGIVRGPIQTDEDISSWEISREDVILAVPNNHPLARKKVVSLSDCKDEQFIMYSSSEVPGLHGIILSLFLGAGFSPKVCQEAVQIQTIVSLVVSGMGIALVPADTQSNSVENVSFVKLKDLASKQCLSFCLVASSGSDLVLVDKLRASIESALSDNKKNIAND